MSKSDAMSRLSPRIDGNKFTGMQAASSNLAVPESAPEPLDFNLKCLSPIEQDVLEFVSKNCNQKAIAEFLGMSQGNVAAKLARAREKLKHRSKYPPPTYEQCLDLCKTYDLGSHSVCADFGDLEVSTQMVYKFLNGATQSSIAQELGCSQNGPVRNHLIRIYIGTEHDHPLHKQLGYCLKWASKMLGKS